MVLFVIHLIRICFDSGYKFLFESNKARHYKTEKMYDLDYIIGKDMVHSLCDREMKPCHLALNFEFRTCLAGRCLCSQNIKKYSNKPAKWLGIISRSHIRMDHIFSK